MLQRLLRINGPQKLRESLTSECIHMFSSHGIHRDRAQVHLGHQPPSHPLAQCGRSTELVGEDSPSAPGVPNLKSLAPKVQLLLREAREHNLIMQTTLVRVEEVLRRSAIRGIDRNSARALTHMSNSSVEPAGETCSTPPIQISHTTLYDA